MGVNLGIAVQQALNELSYLVTKKRALVNKANLPTLDVPFTDIKNVFHGIFYNILTNHDGNVECKINMGAVRDLNAPFWVFTIKANVRSLDESVMQPINLAVNSLGGKLEFGQRLNGSIVEFTLPYNKVTTLQ